MTGRLTLAVLVALAAIPAGCGGGGSGPGQQSRRASFEEAALRHAECMRRHGVDLPDPKPGERGLILMGRAAQGADAETQRRAMEACEEHLKDLRPPPHARCMRRQGVDFPDPTFGPDGSISIELDERVDPSDLAVQRADQACARFRRGVVGRGGPGGPEPKP